MSFRIEKISLQQIGPFGEFTLEFPKKRDADKAEIHILTGENGTGKSTVLEMMAWRLENFGNMKSHFKSRKLTRGYSEAKLICYNSHTVEYIEVSGTSGSFGSLKAYKDNIKDATNEEIPFAFFAYSGYRMVMSTQITGIQEIQGHPLGNALDFQASSNPQQILQWLANTIAAEAIANSQGEEKEARQRRKAVHQIETTIGEIINKTVQFKLETKPYAVKIEVDSERLDFSLLPDGLKSIISWVADLLMRMDRLKWVNDTPVFERNFILFLDEIEVHMHPAWQRKILPAVQKLFPNAQIFISTHSPFVVGSVDGAWVHKLVKPNGDSQLAEGYPMLSEDAKSYRYWLNEVFDIDSEYGVEAEKQLKRFYDLRNDVLKGAETGKQQALASAGKVLADQSQELRQIMEMELRQINRRLGLDLTLS
jgi:predicted ATP-binding protein involved in virulence